MLTPNLLDQIYFFIWNLKINEVHASIPLDDQQLCIRYYWSLGDLYDSDRMYDEIQLKRVRSEIPFALPITRYYLEILADDKKNMLAHLPHESTLLRQYIKNQNGTVSDEVIDLLYDHDYRHRTHDATRLVTGSWPRLW